MRDLVFKKMRSKNEGDGDEGVTDFGGNNGSGGAMGYGEHGISIYYLS